MERKLGLRVLNQCRHSGNKSDSEPSDRAPGAGGKAGTPWISWHRGLLQEPLSHREVGTGCHPHRLKKPTRALVP